MGENEEVGNRQRGLPYVLACRLYHMVSRRGQIERCAPTQRDVRGYFSQEKADKQGTRGGEMGERCLIFNRPERSSPWMSGLQKE